MEWTKVSESVVRSIYGERVADAGRNAAIRGRNMVWLDPTHDLVVVVRWLATREVNEFVRHVLRAF